MNPPLRIAAFLVVASAGVLLFQACGGGTSEVSSGDATTLDLTSVSTGINEVSNVIPICSPSGQAAAEWVGPPLEPQSWAARFVALATDKDIWAGLNMGRLTSTKPQDQFGDCGGRVTYPTYNHSNGVTTGSYKFENYCTTNSDTGDRTTRNGTITFTDTGTPTSSGPVTTKVEASSPAGVSLVTRKTNGTISDSREVAFTDMVYTAGVPGGSATSGSPDRITVAELKSVNGVNGKTYKQTNLVSSSYNTSSGGQQATVSGRGYRSNGEYYDISTTTPLTMTSSGSYSGGALTFTGADNTKAVLIVVPGPTLQGTMTVNGTPVTNVPACR